jgi:hypothetical protein
MSLSLLLVIDGLFVNCNWLQNITLVMNTNLEA